MALYPKKKVILVADDDIEDQELLEEAILEADPAARADMVSNGREVLEYLEKCADADLPAAIVLDYSMPILNGAEVLAIMCNDPRFESIPRFIWSTSNSKIHVRECMDKGATNYFVKPDSRSKLIALAKDILAACNEQ